MTVSPRPPVVGTAQLEIRLRDAEGRPLAASAMTLEGNMTHPGMKPSRATARPASPDRWQAELELTMGGDWIVLVEARLLDGRTVERILPLPGVEAR